MCLGWQDGYDERMMIGFIKYTYEGKTIFYIHT